MTMTKRKPLPAKVYPPGFFSEPVRAWKGMRFESQIHVDPRTGRMETDYARQNRIREASGWTAINWAQFGRVR